MTNEAPGRSTPMERTFAYIIVGVVALSLLSFLAVIIATAMGIGDEDGFSEGVWPLIIVFPLFGLPIAFVLIVALIIIAGARRRRETS